MEELMIPQHPLPQREEDRQAPTATDDRQKPEMNEPTIPQSPPPDADYQDQFAQQPLKAKIQSIASPKILMDTTAVGCCRSINLNVNFSPALFLYLLLVYTLKCSFFTSIVSLSAAGHYI